MDNNFAFTLALVIPFLIWITGVALGVLVMWMTIRSAVRRALRDHFEWAQAKQFAERNREF